MRRSKQWRLRGVGSVLWLLAAVCVAAGCGGSAGDTRTSRSARLAGGERPATPAPPAGDRAAELADALLGLRVRAELLERLGVEALELQIGVDRGQVVLSGPVATPAARSFARDVAMAVDGVIRVASLVEVVEPPDVVSEGAGARAEGPPPAARSELIDAMLLTRVKLRLAEELGGDVLDIEVDVRRGVVSLAGEVGRAEQRARALAAARAVGGVEEVRDQLTVAS